MTDVRRVLCARCGATKAGLAAAPLSGDVGQLVYARTCEDCWAAWFEQSVGVINHLGLNPAIRSDRLQLYEVMKEFLGLTND